jgi:hypothetical protein
MHSPAVHVKDDEIAAKGKFMCQQKRPPPFPKALFCARLRQSRSALLAGLVAYRAGSFAGRLAGRRTFAATARTQGFRQVAFVYGSYVFFHGLRPPGI